MARKPHPGIVASSPPSGGGKRYWIARLDARLNRPSPAAVGAAKQEQLLPTTGLCQHPNADRLGWNLPTMSWRTPRGHHATLRQ
jgi:hypothetical protein